MARLQLDRTAISSARTQLDALQAAIDTSARKIADAKAALANAERGGATAAQLTALKAEVARLEGEHRALRGEAQRNAGADPQSVGDAPRRPRSRRDGDHAGGKSADRAAARAAGDPVPAEPDAAAGARVSRHAARAQACRGADRGGAGGRRSLLARPLRQGRPGGGHLASTGRGAPRTARVVDRARAAADQSRAARPGRRAARRFRPTWTRSPASRSSRSRRCCPIAGARSATPGERTARGARCSASGARMSPTCCRWRRASIRLPRPRRTPTSSAGTASGSWISPAAVAQGMGIQITQAQVNQRLAQLKDATPFTLGAQLDRLVVVGADWTLGPDDAAGAVAAALEAHAATNGLSFVPIGTPTNNTGTGPSGLSSAAEAQTPPPPDKPPAATAGKFEALELLRRALGLPATALAPDAVPYADLAEQRLMLHMINALWRGTLANYLSLLWNLYGGGTKYVSASAIAQLRQHAVAYLRPAGALPCLRVGKQPYGILPVVARSFVAAAPVEIALMSLLGVLRPRWEVAGQDGAAHAGTEPRQAVRADPERALVGRRQVPRGRESELLAGGEPARRLHRDPAGAQGPARPRDPPGVRHGQGRAAADRARDRGSQGLSAGGRALDPVRSARSQARASCRRSCCRPTTSAPSTMRSRTRRRPRTSCGSARTARRCWRRCSLSPPRRSSTAPGCRSWSTR